MTWEPLPELPSPKEHSDYISLSNVIGKSLGNNAVELMYDREKNRIGFRPVSPDSHAAHKVIIEQRFDGPRWHISMGEFLNYFDLAGVMTHNFYEVTMDEDIYIIDLNNPLQQKMEK